MTENLVYEMISKNCNTKGKQQNLKNNKSLRSKKNCFGSKVTDNK